MEDERILSDFAKAYPYFDEVTIGLLAGRGSIIQVFKKEVFIRRGTLDKRVGFVVKGLFKGSVPGKDDDQILWFSNELDMLASYTSILENKPSNITYEALEDSTIFVFGYDDIRQMAKGDLGLAAGLITLLEKLLLESYHRMEKFVLFSAEDRYRKLLSEKPDILNRVPQKLLASYIGITPVSLSRMRSRLAQR